MSSRIELKAMRQGYTFCRCARRTRMCSAPGFNIGSFSRKWGTGAGPSPATMPVPRGACPPERSSCRNTRHGRQVAPL